MKVWSEKQKIIISLLQQHGQQKTADFNQALKHFYYHNHEHYVSEILTRMVRSNIIERVSFGVYRLKKAPAPSPDNQIGLF